MPRLAFVMLIQPGTEDDDDRRHPHVWLGMLAELRAVGAQQYSLFRTSTTLFAYLEVADVDHYQQYVAASPIAAQWEASMSDMLLRAVAPTTDFPRSTEVFHLVNQEHHPGAPLLSGGEPVD